MVTRTRPRDTRKAEKKARRRAHRDLLAAEGVSRKKSTCSASGKVRFPDNQAAVAAALRVSLHVGPLRCYACPSCGGWHFTRMKVWKGTR